MSTDEQETRKDGGVPNSFGNALAWTWTRQMPRGLKGGFLCTLYALRAMAAPSGELRFKDGKPIRIQDIAKAAGCREQDARRYMEAGRLAGVVLVDGERRRGRATRYVISPVSWPDWKAAEHYLKGTARRRQEEEPEQSSGHSGTNSPEAGSVHSGTNQIGPQRHELEADDAEGNRSTVARMGSGHSGTNGSVHSGPNNPGVTQGVTHVLADVGTQAQVVGGSAANSDHSSGNQAKADDEPFGRCEECHVPLVRPGRKRCGLHAETPARGRNARAGRARPIQAPLMTVVAGDAAGPQAPTEAPQQPATKIPNPWAPERTCGCGRTYRTGESACPLCIDLQRQEIARLAAHHPSAHTA
ncbi:hypothetical protein [Streptomyces sp. OK228]|uniref:hypothetical protein n=1 Tax=Streptomyces sp. OK228 TaxID=1882786 RepID=UPI000BCBB763|nr:hypothetical protein [Streptomyces sp. OK228]SOE31707.1 hypothetical protein SAMN05442782_8637 [Streptomyces sp. OK228]